MEEKLAVLAYSLRCCGLAVARVVFMEFIKVNLFTYYPPASSLSKTIQCSGTLFMLTGCSVWIIRPQQDFSDE